MPSLASTRQSQVCRLPASLRPLEHPLGPLVGVTQRRPLSLDLRFPSSRTRTVIHGCISLTPLTVRSTMKTKNCASRQGPSEAVVTRISRLVIGRPPRREVPLAQRRLSTRPRRQLTTLENISVHWRIIEPISAVHRPIHRLAPISPLLAL